MTPKVSVIVPVIEPIGELFPLFGSLDQQTLPYEAFEVVVAVPAGQAGNRSRLDTQAGRRPNVRIVETDHATPAALCTAAVGASTGEHLLTVRPQDRLLPQSLQRLLDHAPDADLIVARSVGLAGAYTDPTVFGAPASPDELAAAVIREPAVLIRRALAEAAPDAVAPEARAALLANAPKISVLVDYPGLDIRGRDHWRPLPAAEPTEVPSGVADRLRELDRPHGPVTLDWDPPTIGWSAGKLLIDCTGRVTGLSEAATVPSAVLRVREPAAGVELALPAQAQWLSAGGDPSTARGLRLRAEVDPASGWDDRPMESAIYQLYADLVGVGFRPQAPLRGCTPSGAVVAGRPVGVVTIEDRLHLDVGCRRRSLVQQADAGDAIITDSARGTLLRIALPRIAAESGTDLPGEIGLGGLKVPARIVEDNGTARLEAYVSGLSGQVRLSTRFGTTWTPLDLVLDISPIGRMQVRPKPSAPAPKAPAPDPKPAAAPDPNSAAPEPGPKNAAETAAAAPVSAARAVYRSMRRLLKQ